MPSAWRRCSATSPPASSASPSAPRLLGGTGKDERISWSSPPPSAASAAASTPRSSGSPARTSPSSSPRARRSRSSPSARRAASSCAATCGKLLVGHVDLSAVKRLGYADAAGIAQDILRRFDAGEFDVCTIFYNRFQSVISQIPTARQLIPAVFEADEPAPAGALRVRARRGGDPRRAAAARRRHPDLHRAAGERRLRAGRADERDGQRHPQRRRHDRPADHRSTTARARPAITKELIEIISGAEAL